MTGKWFHLAKAEYRIQTGRFGRNAKLTLGSLFLLGIVWALVIAPWLMTFLIESVLGVEDILLILAMPGFMRAGLMVIWFAILLIPISNSLKEIQIGQWEILLSNNVKTRDMLVGSYLGKLPINGLLVLFAAPILLAPFVAVLQVGVLGQIFMYSEIIIATLSTIWVSNLLSVAIQSKLGESPRGKDIANALAILLGIVVIIPFVGMQIAASAVAELLQWDLFLVMPFTWSADVVTWSAIAYNGVGYVGPLVTLGLDISLLLLLQTVFIAGVVVLGISTADRLFSVSAGASVESVVSSGSNNIFLRAIKRITPKPFGILLVTTMKDFGRKVQNLSKLSIMVVLSIAFPIILGIRGGYALSDVDLRSILVMMGFAFAVLGGMTFGGVGFLESKDQLWMIRTAPRGPRKFILVRVVQAFLFIVPIVVVSSTTVAILFQLSLVETAFIMPILMVAGFGSALVGVGMSARNPTYDDSKSEAFKSNASRTTMITIVCFGFYQILDFALGIMDFGAIPAFIASSDILYLIAIFAPLPIVGVFIVLIGLKSISRSE